MLKLKTILVVLALFLVSLPIYKPLFDPGFFPVHDDMQVQRVFEMANALKDGQFPVRILSNFGYGYHYALFNFYAPLPYYIGAFFNLIGFSPLISTKLMFFLPNFLSIVFMFVLIKKITKNSLLAFFAAILYAYLPYRAADTYVRGVVGEIYVMIFLPLLVLGIYEIIHKFQISNFKFQISLAGIILSHNIYAYIVCLGLSIFVVVFFLFNLILSVWRKPESTFLFLKFLFILVFDSLFSLALTAFFWLPAILENKFTHLEKINQAGYYFGNYFINLKDLWASDWGYGGAAGGMTFMIGKTQLVFACVMIFVFVLRILRNKKIDLASSFFLLLSVVSIFMTNRLSFLIWEKFPLMSLVQYPMRFIFFIDFFLIIFVILVFSKIKISKFFQISLITLISLLVIFKTQGLFRSKFNYNFTEKYISLGYIKWDVSRMADEYLPKEFEIPININEVADNSIKSDKQVDSKIFENKSDELIARVIDVKEETIVSFPVTNFPGWKMYVNGEEQQIQMRTKYNLISGIFQKGNYIVKLKFENTLVRIIGDLISLISLICLISFMAFACHSRESGNPGNNYYGRRDS